MLNANGKRRAIRVIVGLFVSVLCMVMVATPTLAASTETATEVANAGGGGIYKVLFIITGIILLAALVALYIMKQVIDKKNEKMWELQEEYKKLAVYTQATEASLDSARRLIKGHTDWRKNALKVDPNLEIKIEQMVNKIVAQNFEEQYFGVELSELHTNIAYGKISEAIAAYEKLEPEVKDYLTINIDQQRILMNRLEREYASNVTEQLKSKSSKLQGNAEELEELNNLLQFFNNLPIPVKKRVPEHIVAEIRQKRASAELFSKSKKPKKDDEFKVDNFLDSIHGAFAIDEDDFVIDVDGEAEEE